MKRDGEQYLKRLEYVSLGLTAWDLELLSLAAEAEWPRGFRDLDYQEKRKRLIIWALRAVAAEVVRTGRFHVPFGIALDKEPADLAQLYHEFNAAVNRGDNPRLNENHIRFGSGFDFGRGMAE